MTEKQTHFNLLHKIINGGISGMIGIACTFPLDLIKTRIQKQQVGPDGSKMYNGIFDALRKIVQTEGMRGLYRGSAVMVVLITPRDAVRFSANDYFRFYLKDKTTNTLNLSRQALAGALTGLVQLIVTVPMELLKIQLQDAGRVAAMETIKTGKLTIAQISATKVTMDLIRSKGIKGLYTGIVPTLCRDVPFCTVYFPFFAILDSYGPRKADGSGEATFFWNFGSAVVAASFSAVMVTPSDVMKTRIQSVTKGAEGDKVYTGVYDAFKDILKHEGPTAFFKGGVCRMMVMAPLYGIISAVYHIGIAEKLLGVEK